MIDRAYVVALIGIVILIQPHLIYLGVPLLFFLFLLVLIPLFLFEGLANFLSPRLQRDLITFRYKQKRGTSRLIRYLALDTPQSPQELKDKAGQLAKAAQAVNMRHPNPIYGPIRRAKLARALGPHLSPANTSFVTELNSAWIGARPGPSLGGLVIWARAAIGGLAFGGWIDTVRSKLLSGVAATISALPVHEPDQPWMTPNYPGVMTFLAWRKLAMVNDLAFLDADPAWLPLSHQRKLWAITALLYGSKSQALLARLLNPSIFGILRKLAQDRARWQSWDMQQQQAAAHRQAEHASRQSYCETGSLTPEEITALISDRAQDSILLNRIWPPGTPATGRSWLGGLPCLPPDMDWPRNRETDLPLHFLAQVDCADLPILNGKSPLPRDGLLLFFSDLDEERLSEAHAVIHVPKAKASVPPRPLPDDLPEIDHSGGKPTRTSSGQRNFQKWPVVPTAVKIWGGSEGAHPKTFNRDYLKQSESAHDANLAALMPPPAKDERRADLYPRTLRKDAEGRPMRDDRGQMVYDIVYNALALPSGFPWCGAGIEAFVENLGRQSASAAFEATNARRYVNAKWNDTDEKRSKAAADADRREALAVGIADLADKARAVLGTRPAALSSIDAAVTERLNGWLATLPTHAPDLLHVLPRAISDTTLFLVRQAVTDPGILLHLPPAAFASHAKWLTPSPSQSQHLMLGPPQRKTNSTAGSGVRLLCLDSDYGPGMMFCDCGVIEYWISPEHLAAGRFDQAYADTAGG